jgi:hypothetical protein
VLKAREAIGTFAADHNAVLVLLGKEDLAEIVAGEKVDLAGRNWVRESTCELRWTHRETGRGAGMMDDERIELSCSATRKGDG